MSKDEINQANTCKNVAYKEIIGLIFSKDRAMQLDALLGSLTLNCRDILKIDLKVLYTTSNPHFDEQYQKMKAEYIHVDFIKETDFREQVLSSISNYMYVLFLVDDDIVVNAFSIKSIIRDLADHNDALGFSLRLGKNTVYCYTRNREQKLPVFTRLRNMTSKYCWIDCEYDFGYPLEVSSSVYRVEDILPLLMQLSFSTPNTMESTMSLSSTFYTSVRPQLLCCETSLVFCNPINLVQSTFNNRAGSNPHSMVNALSGLFDKGFRVDVEKYKGFKTNACHQEVELVFYNINANETSVENTAYDIEKHRMEGGDSSGSWQDLSSYSPENLIKYLASYGFKKEDEPLRVHLGCGEQHFNGYLNIDFPPAQHSAANAAADVFADITKIDFPPESVDEVRLHHVFEHFNRVAALAMLIKWHSWLKTGGILHIETPDILASSKTLLSDVSFNVKMGVVRHLAGVHSTDWAYHVDHWFPERFTLTLQKLGFEIVKIYSKTWNHEPFLSNVEVIAKKTAAIPRENLLKAAEALLWYSTVSPAEKATFDIWKQQLQSLLAWQAAGNLKIHSLHNNTCDAIPLAQIHDFNQLSRDKWVQGKAAAIQKGSRVLDVGAGTCPYRKLFSHCEYYSQDFKKYDGVKLGGTCSYGNIDIVSSIEDIPVEDESFDVILCTEVLEHVPEPMLAIKEMARILKPGGHIFITAPLGSGLHQLPYHYYGGFTPQWYKCFFQKNGLKVTEILPNGGFFKQLAQECARVAWTFDLHKSLHEDKANHIYTLFNEELPRYLYNLDEKCPIPEFTAGYFVEGIKEQQP